jgi:hypothetical protein
MKKGSKTQPQFSERIKLPFFRLSRVGGNDLANTLRDAAPATQADGKDSGAGAHPSPPQPTKSRICRHSQVYLLTAYR